MLTTHYIRSPLTTYAHHSLHVLTTHYIHSPLTTYAHHSLHMLTTHYMHSPLTTCAHHSLHMLTTHYICTPLTHICNKSILSGDFPDRTKFSIVKYIYKKGDKKNPTNYRPITLLTSFSKVFEKAL
jgi:Notch-like protein